VRDLKEKNIFKKVFPCEGKRLLKSSLEFANAEKERQNIRVWDRRML